MKSIFVQFIIAMTLSGVAHAAQFECKVKNIDSTSGKSSVTYVSQKYFDLQTITLGGAEVDTQIVLSSADSEDSVEINLTIGGIASINDLAKGKTHYIGNYELTCVTVASKTAQ